MYEVELKVRAAHDPLRTKLANRGLEPDGRVTEEDTYYDAPHRAFGQTDEALRVRRRTRHEAGEAIPAPARLTYKGPLIEDDSKTREEFESSISDPDAVARALDALGFSPAAVVKKERERFFVEGFVVTLDDVTDLGEFVEIERAVEREEQVESTREAAADVLRELGLDPEVGIRTSYLGLLLGSDE